MILRREGAIAVRLAGRDRLRAEAAASKIGGEACRVDLADATTWAPALAEVDLVVLCTDAPDTSFASFVASRGLAFIDITADDAAFKSMEALDGEAVRSGARMVLSVGLAPGLTNLLVRACADRLDVPETATIGVLLGLGDSHGAAAVNWMIDAVKRSSRLGLKTRRLMTPWSARPWPFVSFPFADQFVVCRTLGLGQARTFLTFDSAILSRVVFSLCRRFGRHDAFGSIVRSVVERFRVGSNRAALIVTVAGRRAGREARMEASLEGRDESGITAMVAAAVGRRLLTGSGVAGVRHIEQMITIDDLAAELRSLGVILRLPEAPLLR